ncbi:MAG: S9 family peptidase [Planctomycetota bacterium]|nr:MAG: S9 family peptidase [Planctomycetota bacterium]
MQYPESKKVPHEDEYWGESLIDSYRWLEQDVRESEEVADWVRRQNELSFQYLGKLPQREPLKARLTDLWDYEKRGVPSEHGGRWFQWRNDGLQNHAVLHVGSAPGESERILLDPNTWSEDGTVALEGLSFSHDGSLLAYGVQEAGSDWRSWRVLDIASGELLPDELTGMKFTSPSWDASGTGLFYSCYPRPEEGEEFTALNLENKLMYHRLGTAESEDVIVYWRPEQPEWGYLPKATKDGRWLWIQVWKGTAPRYRIYLQDLWREHAAPVPLVDEFEFDIGYVWNDGPIFWVMTSCDAPKQRVVRIDVRKPEPENWCEIVPEAEGLLLDVSFVGGRLFCHYLKDASSVLRIFDLEGRDAGSVPLPGIGTAAGFGGEPHDTQCFYSFSSFAEPPSIWRYDLLRGESEVIWRAELDFAHVDYLTEQRWCESKDGTRVPIFVTRRRDIELDGSHPCLLYGYGGFNVSLQPGFTVSRALWLEQGGIYAVANLRGGGEYGEEWHAAGTKLRKQNVFDDFIAAAEYLCAEGFTSSEKLAIQGGSNGGLLIGACMCQRPDLFAVALPAVGVMDMLRFDAFTAGRFWTDDYGSASDSEEMFRYLLGYSPLHQLREGVEYPATLVSTADTDDRVVPGHSFKFTARLQECHAGERPVLIRVETRAGHGSGKPTSKLIEELADVYAFTLAQLG